jgi:hypothetical protein
MQETTMEQEPLNPLVDEAIQLITERIGHPLRCPMCGSEEWSAVHNHIVRFAAPIDISEAEIDVAVDPELCPISRADRRQGQRWRSWAITWS